MSKTLGRPVKYKNGSKRPCVNMSVEQYSEMEEIIAEAKELGVSDLESFAAINGWMWKKTKRAARIRLMDARTKAAEVGS